MSYAYIKNNIADLWSEASSASERLNQALFADIVKIGQKRNQFIRVTKTDGYIGWCDQRYLLPISIKNAKEYMCTKRRTVSTQTAVIKNADSTTVEPHFIYYGTKLKVISSRNNKAKAMLPDNSIVMLTDSKLTKAKFNKATGSSLVREVTKFLGIPYLWGGLSPAGFDCSGLIQAVCARFGIDIPRDTRDQIKIGQKVATGDIRTGDLLFFDRHVGFALGNNRLIHSSVGGGGVRINSLKPTGEAYRSDLHHSFKTARRII
jgi:cell wall-associated NlpC family hydrolase